MVLDDYGYYDKNRKPTKREHEQFRENLRESMTRNLWDNARLLDSDVLMRHVDEDAVTKCRLSIYDQRCDCIAHNPNYAEDYADIERARDASIDPAKLQDRADPREIPLDESLEALYFCVFGTGTHGKPVPDRVDGGYTCDCGLKMMMPWRMMRLHCPKCGRLTPIGELKEEGALHR